MFRVLAREMFNMSFRELIVSCSIFKKIDSYRVSSIVIMLDEDPESKDDKINLKQWMNIFDEGNWIEKTVLAFVSPFSSYPTLESRDEILV